jgi:hypothetical protein
MRLITVLQAAPGQGAQPHPLPPFSGLPWEHEGMRIRREDLPGRAFALGGGRPPPEPVPCTPSPFITLRLDSAFQSASVEIMRLRGVPGIIQAADGPSVREKALRP